MPVTIGLVAAGTQALTGLGQTLFSGKKKRQRELEEYAKQSPMYTGNKQISDYYQQALNRYQESPYQSQQYMVGAKNAQRATATGISALQSRGGAIGGISRMAGIQNDALQNLGAQAEAQRNQRFGQLGGATQMKSADEMKKFDINQMTPYNRQLQLKQMKAQAAADAESAGLQTIAGGLGNAAAIGAASAGGTSGGSSGGLGGLFGGGAKKSELTNALKAANQSRAVSELDAFMRTRKLPNTGMLTSDY